MLGAAGARFLLSEPCEHRIHRRHRGNGAGLLYAQAGNRIAETSIFAGFIERQRIRGIAGLKDFEVEYHKRIAAPFAAFVLSIIGASLSARKRKGGMGTALGIGLALSATYILLQGICATFSTQAGMQPWLAAWLPNLIYLPVAIFLYRKAPR